MKCRNRKSLTVTSVLLCDIPFSAGWPVSVSHNWTQMGHKLSLTAVSLIFTSQLLCSKNYGHFWNRNEFNYWKTWSFCLKCLCLRFQPDAVSFVLVSLPGLSLCWPLTVERKTIIVRKVGHSWRVLRLKTPQLFQETSRHRHLVGTHQRFNRVFWELYAPEINGVSRRPLLFTDRFLSSLWWNILWRFQIAVTLREVLTSKNDVYISRGLQRIYLVLIRLSTRSLNRI